MHNKMTIAARYRIPEQIVMTDTYPVLTRRASGEVNGILTEILYVTFADKLLFTICQNGRLGHWVNTILLIIF